MSVDSRALTKTPNIVKYLQDIGIEEPIRERIEIIHSHIQKIAPCKVLDIFIDDYFQEDGTHIFEDLTFFSEEGVIGAIEFLKKLQYTFTPKDRLLTFVRINSKNYDFGKANSKSRLNLTYYLAHTPEVHGLFKATGNNCDYLMEIYKKYIKPKLIKI